MARIQLFIEGVLITEWKIAIPSFDCRDTGCRSKAKLSYVKRHVADMKCKYEKLLCDSYYEIILLQNGKM